MSKLIDWIAFFKKSKKALIVFLIVNIVLTVVFVNYKGLDKQYIATTKVVFNNVKLSFQGNRAEDLLFKEGGFAEFVSFLESDSLLQQIVEKYDYASRLNIPPSNPERNKVARQILRNQMLIQFQETYLEVSLKGEYEEIIEPMLLDMLSLVKKQNQEKIAQNNEMTKRIALKYLESINRSLPKYQDLSSELPQEIDTALVKAFNNTLSHYYGKEFSQKMSIISAIEEINRAADLPKYEPYFIINKGVKAQGIQNSVLAFLIVIGNVVALVFEFQILFFLHYLRSAVNAENA